MDQADAREDTESNDEYELLIRLPPVEVLLTLAKAPTGGYGEPFVKLRVVMPGGTSEADTEGTQALCAELKSP